MRRNISQFLENVYDVLVIGGGINGAAIARMAALNGLKAALLEKGDFASGASSKSTKLIHGGLRYLENFEFGLVRESLKERFIQLKSAPHLVKPLRFIIPVYKNDRRPLWLMKCGVVLYDWLSGPYLIAKHQFLSAQETAHQIPRIQKENLIGGIVYYDAQMNDARLCLENVLSALEAGARVANYVDVKSLIKENGKAVGAVTCDLLTGNMFEVKAKKIVCAAGPWINIFREKDEKLKSPRVRTTKGVHIVYGEKLTDDAVLLRTRGDNRVFFVIPWLGSSLIGTTDTDFKGDPDSVETGQEDIEYLMTELSHVFPKIEFSEEKIVTTFAGLRPLVYKYGSPSKISRKHLVEQSSSGVFYVMGGKYTTYRKIAEDTLKRIGRRDLIHADREYPLYGGGKIEETPQSVSQKYHLSVETIQYLMRLYGTKYRDVLILTENNFSLREPLCSCSPAIRAQVVYAIQTEMAVSAQDIFERRLGLVNSFCKNRECLSEIKRMMLTSPNEKPEGKFY